MFICNCFVSMKKKIEQKVHIFFYISSFYWRLAMYHLCIGIGMGILTVSRLTFKIFLFMASCLQVRPFLAADKTSALAKYLVNFWWKPKVLFFTEGRRSRSQLFGRTLLFMSFQYFSYYLILSYKIIFFHAFPFYCFRINILCITNFLYNAFLSVKRGK